MGTIKKAIAGAIVVIALIGGVVAYNLFKTPEQASAPIQAQPLAQVTAQTTNGEVQATTGSAPTVTTAAQSTPTTATVATAVTESTATTATVASAPTESATTTNAGAPVGATVLQIVQSESQARFVIDEVLNNAPKTVIGTTDQVAGEIAIDAQNPSNSKVGVIQVNARTLVTDSQFRDRAIKNAILQTNEYEFVTFTPSAITGLPTTGAVGQSYTFQMSGDLTIRNVTKPITFDVTVTPESETRIKGTATASIKYADYSITIPQVRQVASVDENVRLEIDFVATNG